MRHDPSAPDAPDFVGLRYFRPPPELAELFSPAYVFTANRPRIADVTRADFAQLRFMLAGGGTYHFSDGTQAETPECCLLGPTLGATRFDCTGPVQVIGVGIQPLGWFALTARDASRDADHVLDLSANVGPIYDAMIARLRAIDDPEEAIAALWAFVATRVGPVAPSARALVAATDAWLADERSPRIADLMDATGLSGRQLERLCNRLYGAPPKYLARKYRALRCAVQIVAGERDWHELIADAFYDQSHMIREIKHFVGATPLRLRSDPSIVIRLTLQRCRVPGVGLARIS